MLLNIKVEERNLEDASFGNDGCHWSLPLVGSGFHHSSNRRPAVGSLQLHQLCLEEESFLQLDQTPTQRRRCLYYLHKSISHLASGYAVLVEFAREILGNGIAWLLRREALVSPPRFDTGKGFLMCCMAIMGFLTFLMHLFAASTSQLSSKD